MFNVTTGPKPIKEEHFKHKEELITSFNVIGCLLFVFELDVQINC